MRTTLVLCDLDDADGRRPGVATVTITIDGADYPLDVCQEHVELLRALPAGEAPQSPRATTARRPSNAPAGGGGAAKRPRKPAAKSPGAAPRRQPNSRRSRQQRLADARAWARSQGRDVADRGRLPAGLLEEYEAAAGR